MSAKPSEPAKIGMKPSAGIGLGQLLMLAVASAILVTVVALSTFSAISTGQVLDRSFESRSDVTTGLLSATVGGAVKFRKADDLVTGFEAFAANFGKDISWIAATDANGAVITTFPETLPEGAVLPDLLAEEIPEEQTSANDHIVAKPVLFGKDNATIGHVIIQWSPDAMNAEVSSKTLLLVVVGLVTAVIVTLASFPVTRALIVRPIRDLDHAMDEMAHENYAISVPHTERRNELGSMARKTEAFRNQLETAKAARERERETELKRKQEREKMLATLENGVGAVARGVLAGDFTNRVDARFDEPTLTGLAETLNTICDRVSEFLNEAQRVSSAVSDGNLTVGFSGEFEGQYSVVSGSLNATVSTLNSTISKLHRVGDEIGSAIGEVSTASRDLAHRAELQAASLEETNATMSDFSQAVLANAENVATSSKRAKEAQSRAEEGKVVVSSAVEAMQAIQEGSNRIADIINVIDTIAFQTNLLALNASVEAARAGESGKGFAVVASEVRALAQRSAEAANDIKSVIGDNTASVDQGSELVQRAGETLESIIESIGEVSSAVTGISEQTNEQSDKVREISSAVKNLDDTTQRNAQIAEESSNQAVRLNKQLNQLSELISYFKATNDDIEPQEPERLSA